MYWKGSLVFLQSQGSENIYLMSIETFLNCVRACIRAMHDMMYREGFLY